MSTSGAPGSGQEGEPPVWRAVKDGKGAEEVRRVIEAQGRSAERRAEAVNQKGPDERTPLQLAVRDGTRGDLVLLLLDNGAKVGYVVHRRWEHSDDDEDGLFSYDPDDASCPRRATALTLCIKYGGGPDSLRALLRAGHDPNQRIDYSPYIKPNPFCTIVHFCLVPPPGPGPGMRGAPALEALELLVREGGADVNARDSYGETPLFWITKMYRDHEAALDLLIRLGADVNAERGPREPGTERRLMDGGGDERDKTGPTPLLNLMKFSEWESWRATFEDHDQDSDEPGWKVRCLRKLMAAGARTTGVFYDGGIPPLFRAAELGHPDVVRILLEEAGARVDERHPQTGETALHAASELQEEPEFYGPYQTESLVQGKAECVTALLDAGADANARDNEGRPPLFGAVFYSEMLPVLQVLLSRGASADFVNEDGYTPLMVACSWAKDRDTLGALVRASSPATRRARDPLEGESAIDIFVSGWGRESRALAPWECELIGSLMASGASVLPENAPYVLPAAASHGLPLAARREAELAARLAAPWSWEAHEAMVGLALDAREAREVDQAVAAAERRIQALEEELRELGGEEEGTGTDDRSESGGGEEEEEGASDEEEGAEATAAGGGEAAATTGGDEGKA